MRHPGATLLAVLVLGASAAPASAQLVHGRVVDEGTGEGIPLARIAVLAGDSVAAGPVTASQAGRFRLRLPGPGSYRIQVERLGYPVHTTLEFEALALEEVEVEIPITPEPIPLAPIEVVARGFERGRDQFNRRRAEEEGFFFDPIHIALDRRAGRVRDLLDIVRRTPGVWVEFNGRSRSAHTNLGWGCLTEYRDNQFMRSPIDYGDGDLPEGFETDLHLAPLDIRDIMAVEVYRSIEDVPREIRLNIRPRESGRCGVILVWTRSGW